MAVVRAAVAARDPTASMSEMCMTFCAAHRHLHLGIARVVAAADAVNENIGIGTVTLAAGMNIIVNIADDELFMVRRCLQQAIYCTGFHLYVYIILNIFVWFQCFIIPYNYLSSIYLIMFGKIDSGNVSWLYGIVHGIDTKS